VWRGVCVKTAILAVDTTRPRIMGNALTNPVHPKKLLLTKWTAVSHVGKEKHFLVSKLHLPEEVGGKLEWIDIEAVYSQASRRIAWRELKDAALWKRGWV
jgi:tryptophan-rich hypothetical protein